MKVTETMVTSYLTYCRRQKNLSPKTLKAYQCDLHQFLRFMETQNFSLDRAALDAYIQALHQNYQPRSIQRKLMSLKAFCSYLVYEDILEETPFAKVRTQFRQPRQLPRTIPLTTIQALFTAAYTQLDQLEPGSYQYRAALRDIAVLELLFATGIRVSELCSLKPQDMNLEEGSFTVFGKGAKERVLHVGTSAAMEALAQYEKAFRKQIKALGYFFVNRQNSRLSDQSVRLMIQKYSQLAGISLHITPHMFRHSFATLLLEEDVDIRYIQQFLGHSSITTTQIYTHVSTSRQKQILQTKHPRSRLNIHR